MSISNRHIRRGTIRVKWVTTLSSTTAPTVAQLNAGTDITGMLQSLTGFEVDRPVVTLPVGDGHIVTALADPVVPGTPTLVLYDEKGDTTAIRSALASGAAGWVVICLDGTPTIGGRANVWPVVSAGPVDRVHGDVDAATFSVKFALVGSPVMSAVIA